MTLRTLPATEVKNRFGRVLRDVSKSGSPILIERDGKPVAVIMGIEQYEAISKRPLPDMDKKNLAREAFGMWANREDLSDEWLKAGREQWYSTWQKNEEE
jgi:prevent-host-death family protein